MCQALVRNTIYDRRLLSFFVHPPYMNLASDRADIAWRANPDTISVLLPITPSEEPNMFQMMTALAGTQLRAAGYNVIPILRDLLPQGHPEEIQTKTKSLPWLERELGSLLSLKEELIGIKEIFDPLSEVVEGRLTDLNPESIAYFNQLLGIVLIAAKENSNAIFIGQPEALHLEPLLKIYNAAAKSTTTNFLPLYAPQLYLAALSQIFSSDHAETIRTKLAESLDEYPRPMAICRAELLTIALCALPNDPAVSFENAMKEPILPLAIRESIKTLADAIEANLCRRFAI
jgi:hypothetical protein